MKILIADDDLISLKLLRNSLQAAGFSVTVAHDGQHALDLYQQHRFRFVITDWEMPGLSGLDLCRAIRRDSDHAYVYVILLTSHSSSEQMVEGMSAGADDFIVKPYKEPELLVRVRAGQRIIQLETREMVIFSMAKLAESRDPETGRHLERVQQYSLALTRRLALRPRYCHLIDDEFIRLVYETSPLHDIGKVGIPDSVLLKPGRLNDDEFNIMKTHTLIGAETLDASLQYNPDARFLQVARDIAVAHHERFDGTGYPYGLKGEAIPLAARIVALADVYDALTSKRVYKEAYSQLLARQLILQEAGAHFDPEIVAAFQDIEQEFAQIYLRLREERVERPTLPPISPIDPLQYLAPTSLTHSPG